MDSRNAAFDVKAELENLIYSGKSTVYEVIMIEEFAHVVAVEESGYAWIEPQRATLCGHCSANQGCSTSWLAKLMGNRQTRIKAIDPIGSQMGDRVTIGIHENALLKSALSIYGVPLLTMIGMSLMGDTLMNGTVYQNSGGIVFGLGGFGIGLAWLRYFARRNHYDTRYLPVIVRRIPAEQAHAIISP